MENKEMTFEEKYSELLKTFTKEELKDIPEKDLEMLESNLISAEIINSKRPITNT